ncbi:MAG: DUF3179 domain-containing protein [Actinobacteria bacterium]|nr:DUF3179 domain-containing protein [Actinomycetota bacterium]
MPRTWVMLLVLTMTVVACAGPLVGPDGATTTVSTTGASTTAGPPGTLSDGPSALDDMFDPSFPDPLVDPEEIVSGGPPPDGIPSIDDPRFTGVEEADEWLEDEEAVVYVEIGDVAHAYPVQILIWHEIVNDTVDGVPIAVTYCPLCNSAVTYRRVVNGEVTTFGTSGRLYASALVMYDRATETLWTHYDGRAVVGILAGEQLDPIPSPLLAWSDFKDLFPDGEVLDRSALGFNRPYGSNPYQFYDSVGNTPFLFRGDADTRALAMQRVVGVSIDGVSRAWTLEAISGGPAEATNTTVGEAPIVIFWKDGQSSALEEVTVSGGRDVGSVGVFRPFVGGQSLTFVGDDDGFRDEQTGSEWSISGRAVDGPLVGAQLEQIHHLDTFWFAWSTYQPGTELVGG